MKAILFLIFSLSAFGQYLGPVTLDDFLTGSAPTGIRLNHNTDPSFSCTIASQSTLSVNCLWIGQADQNSICSVVTPGQLHCSNPVLAAPDGMGFWFNTLSGNGTGFYGLANSYLPSYIKSGTWYAQMNRYYWSFKCNTDVNFSPTGPGHWLEAGVYGRNVDDPNPQESGQGLHGYQFFNPQLKANQWVSVVSNRVWQHIVSLDANQNWCEDQLFNQCFGVADGAGAIPTHDYDGETHHYFGPTYAAEMRPIGTTCDFGPVTLGYVTGEPDAYVSNITGMYDTSLGEYTLSWNSAKHVPGRVTFDVVYSTSELHAAGFSSGTVAGTAQGEDDAPYPTVMFSTPPAAQAPTMYVGIRPHMDVTTATSSIQLTTRVEHFLSSGDQVTVSGVCANANGTRTISVVDAFNFTIGVSGTCTYGGTGGRVVATSNTSNFAELRITPPTTSFAGGNLGGKLTVRGSLN
jgi:hypothetical protein